VAVNSGVAAAFGAAAFYNLAVTIQKRQAQRESADGIRLVVHLFARPLWLLGLIVQLSGLALHVFALTRSPVTVVQPIIAAGIVFLVLFAALVLGEFPRPRELAGMGIAALGIGLLLSAVGQATFLRPLSGLSFAILCAAMAALVTVASHVSGLPRAAADGRAAVLAGVASGCAQGMGDAMNRLMGAWLSPGTGWVPPATMGVAAVLALACFGATGLVIAQNALKRFRANTVVPSMITAELLVPVAIAICVYGQPLPAGQFGVTTWAVALLMILAGIWTLATSARVASQFTEAG